MLMQKQIILKIFGKVQGVFFRDSSQKRAKELNLSGYVQNEPDGTVLIVAEGEEKGLKEFIEWCQNWSSDYGKVDKVDREWLPATGQLSDFIIN